MAEYIKREDAITDAFCGGVSCQECPFLMHPVHGGCKIEDYIKSIPAADVVERKHGKWEHKQFCSNLSGYEYACFCSICGKPTYRISLLERMPNFCPNCGAEMDTVKGEE